MTGYSRGSNGISKDGQGAAADVRRVGTIGVAITTCWYLWLAVAGLAGVDRNPRSVSACSGWR